MTDIALARRTAAPANPLDVIERLVDDNDWPFDRRNDEEMAVQVPGRWCDYSLYFAWNEKAQAMQVTCGFDMRVRAERRPAVQTLIVLANESLWIGHFSLWNEEGVPLFRHVLPLRGTQGPSVEQLEDIVESAIVECERFYPAFQYVVWGGRTPAEAIEAALIETLGEA